MSFIKTVKAWFNEVKKVDDKIFDIAQIPEAEKAIQQAQATIDQTKAQLPQLGTVPALPVVPPIEASPVQIQSPIASATVGGIGRMQLSQRGCLDLANREGLSQTAYLDSVGVKTIGIGMTASDIPDLKSWAWDKSLDVPAVCSMYKTSLQPYIAAVNKAVKVNITQWQFDALVSICYNIGVGGLEGSTFVKKINSEASMDEIISAIMMWDKPSVIIGRRQQEANLFRVGAYSDTDGSVDNILVNPTTHKPSYKGRVSIIAYL